MNPTSLSAKSAASRRQLLLESIDSVNPRDFDPSAMDISTDHRSFMREQLYGRNRVTKIINKKSIDNHEVWDNVMGDADGITPKWISTFKAEYTPKVIVSEKEKIKEGMLLPLNIQVANYIKKAHFTLDRGSEPSYTSITKKDFTMDSGFINKRPDYNEFVKSYSRYPPIFRDEQLETFDSRLNHDSQTRKVSVIKSEPNYTADSNKTKNKTHISLGNDITPWISVTKSSMKPFDRIDREDSYKKESNIARSTVLDCPDMEKVPMTSIHQQDMSNLDRKSLIIDTASFIKDLKATHFSLGDPSMEFGKSQYDESFKRHDYGPRIKTGLPPAAFPAQRQCIIAEDCPDRKCGSSSQKDDFKDMTNSIKTSYPPQAGIEIKNMNRVDSVSFGTNDPRWRQSAVSVTSRDYRLPNEIDHNIAQEAYNCRGVTRKPDIPFFDPINIDSEVKGDYTSVAMKEYTLKVQDKSTKSQSHDNKMYLRTHHFSLGEPEQPDRARVMVTLTHSHFKDPSSLSSDDSMMHTIPAGYNGPSSKLTSSECNNYETTLANTISRHPHNSSAFETVSSNAYKPLIGASRATPFKPRGDLLGEYLHPLVTSDGPIRELTTVTRRSYVPPEVKKFQ